MAEVQRSFGRALKHLSDHDQQALCAMVDAVVNKLLHGPVTRIKALASDPHGDELVAALDELFALHAVLVDEAAPEPKPDDDMQPKATPAAREPLGR